MSTNVTFNGVSYTVPALAEASWGTNVSNYLIAIASGCLQKTGGAFTLSTADIDFGPTYGLKALYFKSRSANISATGVARLANAEAVSWRNAANSADLGLAVNASNVLAFNGNPIVTLALGAGNTALTMNSGGTAYAWTTITNAQIDAAAAIAYSKLNLTGAILNADLAGSIAYSKLSLAGAILNSDLAGSIAYSKLSLAGAILNSDLAGSIAYSKLSLAGAILNSDLAGSIAYSKLSLSGAIATGDIASGLLLGISNGGTGQTSANAALNALLPAQGSSAGKLLSTNGTNTSWASAASSTLNQFNTDIGDSGNTRQATNTSLLGDVKASTGSSAVTVTIAAPGVVSFTSHGLATGDKVYLTTTGALPTGLSASTTYWVRLIDANSFSLATTLANAVANTTITTTGSQSGTHTLFFGGMVLTSGVKGVVTNSTATAGYVGEYKVSSRLRSAATSLTTNTPGNVCTAITLTPGDWEVWGAMGFSPAASTSITDLVAAISATDGVLPATDTYAVGNTSGEITSQRGSAATVPARDITLEIPRVPVTVAAGTTLPLYLVQNSLFSVSTMTAYGSIMAKRIR